MIAKSFGKEAMDGREKRENGIQTNLAGWCCFVLAERGTGVAGAVVVVVRKGAAVIGRAVLASMVGPRVAD